VKLGFSSKCRVSPRAPLASRPARARPPNAPVPRAAPSTMSGAVRTPPSPTERSEADKRRRFASRQHTREERQLPTNSTRVLFARVFGARSARTANPEALFLIHFYFILLFIDFIRFYYHIVIMNGVISDHTAHIYLAQDPSVATSSGAFCGDLCNEWGHL
jgi:hypothetical protein